MRMNTIRTRTDLRGYLGGSLGYHARENPTTVREKRKLKPQPTGGVGGAGEECCFLFTVSEEQLYDCLHWNMFSLKNRVVLAWETQFLTAMQRNDGHARF